MDNPFFYGKAVSGDFFTDRKEELKQLKDEIKSSQNIIIWSPRRYGKTSLIRKVLFELEQEELITVYVDLFMATSKEKFIDIYAKAIIRSIEGNIEKMVRILKKLLPKIVPKIVVRSNENADFEFGYDIRTDTMPILEDLFEAVFNYAKKKGKKAVVCFDEFQEIANFQKKNEIEKTMRSIFQFHDRVAYVFLGSKYHLMQEMFQNRSRPFYNSGRIFSLKQIPEKEFSDWIKKRFQESRINISKTVIDSILKITKCHPYHTQQLCHVIWNVSKASVVANEAHIKEALSEIVDEQTANFTNIWDTMSAKQRSFSVAFALDRSANPYSKDFILKNNLGTPSGVQKVVKALVDKQILERDNGNISFGDVFFPEWIKERQ